MKKTTIFLFLLVSVISFSACGKKLVTDDTQQNPQTESIKNLQTYEPQNGEDIREDDIELNKEDDLGHDTPDAYIEYINTLQYLDEIESKIPRSTTTLDMVETRITALNSWDEELNKIYALLLESLSNEEIKELRTEQRLWIKEKDEAANNALSLGGSYAKVDYNDILFLCTKQRTLELISVYFGKTNDFSFEIPFDVSTASDVHYVEFNVYDVQEKYYGGTDSFIELDLKLPTLTGNYEGIPIINEFFANKQSYFYEQLPFDYLLEGETRGKKIEGKRDGYFVSAYYYLETILGNIISVPAVLDGGAGGVSWVGFEATAFDLNTGKKLGLSDIFSVSEEEYMEFIYDFVSKKITENLKSEERNGYLFQDAYSEEGMKMIRDFNRDNFILSNDTLTVFYNKYELAAGAYGMQAFEIPYESIMDILAIHTNKS